MAIYEWILTLSLLMPPGLLNARMQEFNIPYHDAVQCDAAVRFALYNLHAQKAVCTRIRKEQS